MTSATVPLFESDLLVFERAIEALARAGLNDEWLALAAVNLRLRGSYFAALPNEQHSVKVPELRVIDGGAA